MNIAGQRRILAGAFVDDTAQHVSYRCPREHDAVSAGLWLGRGPFEPVKTVVVA
jgi:hypothetical protein